jgi:hypothetical protein
VMLAAKPRGAAPGSGRPDEPHGRIL